MEKNSLCLLWSYRTI